MEWLSANHWRVGVAAVAPILKAPFILAALSGSPIQLVSSSSKILRGRLGRLTAWTIDRLISEVSDSTRFVEEAAQIVGRPG
jgi:hypothetical protein